MRPHSINQASFPRQTPPPPPRHTSLSYLLHPLSILHVSPALTTPFIDRILDRRAYTVSTFTPPLVHLTVPLALPMPTVPPAPETESGIRSLSLHYPTLHSARLLKP
ncbi:hypothetical protein Hypma_012707 [Hypsizygus marmoreus]|uniref:Uncharacterized protein n=1 Tax=Hypsizygus marmoreus TaxID=39966 RepID=A0A369JIX4_HYPMA|nr:hypothetical protein Hypma_012707 [Hypsizygus marmoreus]